MRSSHPGKQTRIATLCKSIGHQAKCPKTLHTVKKKDRDVAPRNQWTCFFCWRLLGLIPGGTPFSQLNKGVRDVMSATTKRDVEHQVCTKTCKRPQVPTKSKQRNQWTCPATQQHGGYPIRALSSPCFLFFRPLLLTSSYWGGPHESG